MFRRMLPGLVAASLMLAAAGCGSATDAGGTGADASTTTTAAPAASAATSAPADPGDSGPAWFFDHLEVGDCWDEVYDEEGNVDRSGTPVVRDCSEPHLLEVVGAFAVPDGPFPGDEALTERAGDECDARFEDYVGASFSDAVLLDGFIPRPDAEQWEAGARRIVCVANFDFGRVAESFEGIGTTSPVPYDFPGDAPVPEDADLVAVGRAQEGERLVSFDVPRSQDEVVADVLGLAAGAGWDLTSQNAASETVFLYLTDAAGGEHTLGVVAADDPGSADLAYYYPAGPLSIYP